MPESRIPTSQSDFLKCSPAFPSSWLDTRLPPANPSMLLCWHPSTCSCSMTEWGGQTDRSTLLRTVKMYLNSPLSIAIQWFLFFQSWLYSNISEDNLLLRGSRLVSWYKRWGMWRPALSDSCWMEAAQLCCQDHKLTSRPAERQKWHSETRFPLNRSSVASLSVCLTVFNNLKKMP